MKSLLLFLLMLFLSNTFANEVDLGSRVIYFNNYRTVVVGTIERIQGNTAYVDIDMSLATGRVSLDEIVAVNTDNCTSDELCEGEVYREAVGNDEFIVGEVKEVFTGGWRVVKEDGAFFKTVLHQGNLEKL